MAKSHGLSPMIDWVKFNRPPYQDLRQVGFKLWLKTYLPKEYQWARLEHAWLLKAEGLRLEDIGAHLGVTRERARQMVVKFGRKARHATHRARWRISYDDDSQRYY